MIINYDGTKVRKGVRVFIPNFSSKGEYWGTITTDKDKLGKFSIKWDDTSTFSEPTPGFNDVHCQFANIKLEIKKPTVIIKL